MGRKGRGMAETPDGSGAPTVDGFDPQFTRERRGYRRSEVDEFVGYARRALRKIAEENRELRRGDSGARDLVRLEAELAQKRDELRQLADRCADERKTLDRLIRTRDEVQRDLDHMARRLRTWLSERHADTTTSA